MTSERPANLTNVVDLLIAKGAERGGATFPALEGPCLGQLPPGRQPEVFAQGIVTGHYSLHSNVVFSPDGKEAFWSVSMAEWSNPRPVEAIVNDLPQHWQFSLDREGDLYFTTRTADSRGGDDIYCSRLVGGQYQAPFNLRDMINTAALEGTPFIAPDGSYLLFTRDGDLYVVFKHSDGTWSESQSLGQSINTPGLELCPTVTADGKYLFYLAQHTIYWVDAGIIDQLRGK